MAGPSRLVSFYERYLKKVPQQPRSRSVVDAILGATVDRISKNTAGDDDAVTVHDIADRAGVSIGSLYDYFRDRQSLLTAAMGKLAQDNLAAFRQVLERTSTMPLREAIETVVDFALDTYATDPLKSRVIMRVTMKLGLMPTLAEGHDAFARVLAAWLRERSDVDVEDVEHAAWVVTQAGTGVALLLVWDDARPDRRAVRDALVAMFVAYLQKRT